MDNRFDIIEEMKYRGCTWRQIGDKVGLSPEATRSLYRRRKRTQTSPSTTTVQQTQQRASSCVSEHIESHTIVADFPPDATDAESLLRYHGYDPAKWSIIESTAVSNGTSYRSRVRVRAVPEQFNADKIIEATVQALSHQVHQPRRLHMSTGGTVVLPLFDVHYGKQSVDGQASLDRSDADIARLVESARDMAQRHGTHNIILVIGQDFFQCDTPAGTTTAGTSVDCCTTFDTMYARGCVAVVRAIERLADGNNLSVVYSRGNHDRTLGYCMAQAMYLLYRESVGYFSVTDRQRQYLEIDGTLVGISHGEEESTPFSSIMQVEAPLAWGSAVNRYWLMGHLHHLAIEDKNGVTTIRCPSISPTDQWHDKKGYVGAIRQGIALYFADGGLQDICLTQV